MPKNWIVEGSEKACKEIKMVGVEQRRESKAKCCISSTSCWKNQETFKQELEFIISPEEWSRVS